MAALVPPSPQPPADGALLVALGAVPGAWLRFRIVNHLEPMVPRKHWGTLAVNGVACLLLGLLLGLLPRCGPGGQRLELLLATGFLGSFSTFSSLMAELWLSLERDPAGEAWLLLAGSLLLGLLLTAIGLAIGAGP